MFTLAKPEFIDGSIVSFQTFAKSIKERGRIKWKHPLLQLS